MFRKLYPRISICGNLTLTISHWVMDKKIVSDNNRELPHYFNIMQLHTGTRLDLYNVSTNGWWK